MHDNVLYHTRNGIDPLLNVLYLMVIAFLPFPTAVLAQAFHRGAGESVAAAFYRGTMTVIGPFVSGI